jgi:tetratricopeptide (TPR) repeat protein
MKRYCWRLALVLAGVLGAGPVSGQQTVNPNLPKHVQSDQLQLRADELQRTGKYAEAAAALQQAAELTPDDWVVWDKAGWAHLDNKQAAEALKAFEQSRKIAPPGTPAGGLIIARFALGQSKETLELLKQELGEDELAAATAVVTKGLAAKEFTPDWSYALGYLYTRVLRNSRRAVGFIEAVASADPKRADAWLLLVEINQDLDRGANEDAAAVKYLELAPETADAFRIRAQRHAGIQQYADAVAEYQAGIARHPLTAELYYLLARLQQRLGRPAEAEATYKKLVTAAAGKNPGLHAQARAQLANFHARTRNYAEAEKFYRETAQRPDATAATWTTWGSLLALSGKWEDAAKALEGAAERQAKTGASSSAAAPDELLAARYRAAVCRLAAGQRPAAKAGLEAALAGRGEARTTPEIEARAFLTWLGGQGAKLEELGYQRSDERWAAFVWRREEQDEREFEVRGVFSPSATAWRAILQQAMKTAPDCWPAMYALGRIYASGGFTKEALELLSRAAQLRNDWWAPFYAIGQYHANRRNKESGIPPLRRVVQLAPECRQARAYLSLLANVRDVEE